MKQDDWKKFISGVENAIRDCDGIKFPSIISVDFSPAGDELKLLGIIIRKRTRAKKEQVKRKER